MFNCEKLKILFFCETKETVLIKEFHNGLGFQNSWKNNCRSLSSSRSSRLQMFFKARVLKNFAKCSWKFRILKNFERHLCLSLFLIKLQASNTGVFLPILQNFSETATRGVLSKTVFLKISHNPEPDHKPEACNFIKKGTLAQVFFCEFCEIFKSSFFYRTLPVDGSA